MSEVLLDGESDSECHSAYTILSPIIDSSRNDLKSEMVKSFATSTQKVKRSQHSKENHPPYQDSTETSFMQGIRSKAEASMSEKCIERVASGDICATGLNDIYQILITGQKQIQNMQQKILEKITNLETEFNSFKEDCLKHRKEEEATQSASNKLLRENIVISKLLHKKIKMYTGEDKDDIDVEIQTNLPVKSIAELSDLDSRLEDQVFSGKLEYALRKQGVLDREFRLLATDDVYWQFNLEGRCGKRALKSLKLYEQILFDAFGDQMGRENYESQLRMSIQRSHNRWSKAKAKK